MDIPDAIAFDLDGTVYLGDAPLPGARELMSGLADAGVPHLFATNNSSVPGYRYVERLRRLGIAADRRNVLTSNDAAVAHLRRAGVDRAFVVATEEVRAEYAAAGVAHDADDPLAVMLTFDTSLDYQKVRRASDLLRAGLPYYATHPDLVCPTPSGPIPDCGAFIALFAASTGREPEVIGKPSEVMATSVRERLAAQGEARGVAPQRMAFVGDRLYTDVRMANEHGFLAVLVLTGEATVADLDLSPYSADLVVEDLTALSAHLRLEPVEPAAPT